LSPQSLATTSENRSLRRHRDDGPFKLPTSWLNCKVGKYWTRRWTWSSSPLTSRFAPGPIAAAAAVEGNLKPASEDDRRIPQVPAARNGLIEIDLGNRRRIRVDAHVDPEALARVLDELELMPGDVRVWLATGHTDMRRGFPSLARLVQEGLKRDPQLVISMFLGAAPATRSSLFGMTARARVCSRTGWSAAASCGHRWRTALST
jgi:hypothetical protein